MSQGLCNRSHDPRLHQHGIEGTPHNTTIKTGFTTLVNISTYKYNEPVSVYECTMGLRALSFQHVQTLNLMQSAIGCLVTMKCIEAREPNQHTD